MTSEERAINVVHELRREKPPLYGCPWWHTIKFAIDAAVQDEHERAMKLVDVVKCLSWVNLPGNSFDDQSRWDRVDEAIATYENLDDE